MADGADILRFAPVPHQQDERATAYHESGHATAAFVFGRQLLAITIVPSLHEALGRLGGHVQMLGGLSGLACADAEVDVKRQRMLQDAVVHYAGPIAQQIACPSTDAHRGAVVDYQRVEEIATLLTSSPESFGSFWSLVEHEARALMLQHWHLVEVLASELLAERTVSGAEAEALLRHQQEKQSRLARELLAAQPISEMVDAGDFIRARRRHLPAEVRAVLDGDFKPSNIHFTERDGGFLRAMQPSYNGNDSPFPIVEGNASSKCGAKGLSCNHSNSISAPPEVQQ